MQKRKLFALLVLGTVVVAALQYIPLPSTWRFYRPCYDKKLRSLPAHTKIIELVTAVPWFLGYAQRYGAFKGCKVADCYLARCSGQRIPDAVAFFAEVPDNKVHQPKIAGQTWFFMTMESPIMTDQLNYHQFTPALYSKFDIAMTYRNDSDIGIPYSTVVKLDNPPKKNLTSVLRQKRRVAAQVASHCTCQSRRAEYIRLMQPHVSVDVFGKCGTLSCPGDCFGEIGRDYKFYLAFENSLCEGYITEKFFAMYDMDIVPVARGNTNYSKLFPPKTFIDTQDFPTAKALADYLDYLDKNDTAYMEYLEAKRPYSSNYGQRNIRENLMKEAFCDMCYHVHTKVPPKRKSDFHTWWSKETTCIEPKDLV